MNEVNPIEIINIIKTIFHLPDFEYDITVPNNNIVKKRYQNNKESYIEFIITQFYLQIPKEYKIPFHIYHLILSTIPFNQNLKGYIYKCATCGYFIVINPNKRYINDIYKKYITPPIIRGFFIKSAFQNYFNYYMQNTDRINRILNQFTTINRKLSYNLTKYVTEEEVKQYYERIFKHFHHLDVHKNICKEIIIERFTGYNLNLLPFSINKNEQNISKIEEYINYIKVISQFIQLENFHFQDSDVTEILNIVEQFRKDFNDIPINIIFTVSTYLVLNRYYLNFEKLLDEKAEIPFRIICNIFGLHYSTIKKWLKKIIIFYH